jgi:hypothetical protein
VKIRRLCIKDPPFSVGKPDIIFYIECCGYMNSGRLKCRNCNEPFPERLRRARRIAEKLANQ